MKVIEINMVEYGSTGKIMLQIAEYARKSGNQVQTYSMKWRNQKKNIPDHTYFGSFVENACHLIIAKTIGFNGCFSYFGTMQLLRKIKAFHPDIIHLHNLHNFCINLPMLFQYIKKQRIRVVWTLHDCWAMTGQCPYFTMAKCQRWKTGCHDCPQLDVYPKCKVDHTNIVWNLKKKWFTGVEDMTIVTPSEWLAGLVKQSYLKNYPVKVINNGIDLSVFRPTESDFRDKNALSDKYIVLGVAFGWGKRKGLDTFIELSKRLDSRYQIVLVGTDDYVEKQLPDSIIAIHRTHNQQELAAIYSVSDVFVQTTREENYPTVNMEALACGTPVVTFRTGGSPEMLDETCGSVVECDDIDAMEREIIRICNDKPYLLEASLQRAQRFDMNEIFKEYVDLYENSTYCT